MNVSCPWRLAFKTRVHSYVQLLSNNEVKVIKVAVITSLSDMLYS